MKNILLLLKNIQNYGLIIFTKMILYEILFSIRFLNLKSLKYEEINNDNYFKTKNKKRYNTPYIPTPYYFLSKINKYFNSVNTNNYLLIDLGCGYSRTRFFFKHSANPFIGFDYNSNIIRYLKNKNYHRSYFFNKDLRKKKNIDFLVNITRKFKKNNKIVIFFSDSFELDLLKKIIISLKKKNTFYCVIVNLKNKNFLKIKKKILFNMTFLNKNRNIFIFKIT